MIPRILDIKECLFDAFANSTFYNAQDERQMWAIREGIERIDRYNVEWRSVTAKKEKECLRNCKISCNDIYFARRISGGKFCAGCTAMILYLRDVHKLPPVTATHWNTAVGRPIHQK